MSWNYLYIYKNIRLPQLKDPISQTVNHTYAEVKPAKAGNTRGISHTASTSVTESPVGLGIKEEKDLHARRSFRTGKRAIWCRLSLIQV